MFSVIVTEVNVPLRESVNFIPSLVQPLHSMAEYQCLKILAGETDTKNT